jgi:hypothetical protein
MIPIDGDMIGFLWTTASIVFGSKHRLRKNTKPIPVRYQRQLLDDSQLTERQRNYIAPIDTQLASLGFLPFYTYRATNYVSNLIRGYQNPADPASCTVTIVEVRTIVKGVIAVKNSRVVNFTTRLADGKELTTRNMELKSLMDSPDYKIMQECPHVTNLAELKKKHDARLASLTVPVSPPRDVQAVIAEFEKDHDRFSAHQLQRGIYRISAAGDTYEMTDKAFHRGIRNFFNPFAKRISPTTVLFSALLGAFLPLYGILKLAPAMIERFGSSHVSLINPSTLAILACYILTGVILGSLADSPSYIWVMLITYVPAHLVAGWTFGGWPYSTAAHLVTFFVCQAKRKRQLVLQS